MTDFEFIRSYQEGNFEAGRLIINCDGIDNGVVQSTPSNADEILITGVIIPVTDNSIQGILENANSIRFTISNNNNAYNVALVIAQKRQIYNNNGQLAYFLKAENTFILPGVTIGNFGTYATDTGYTEVAAQPGSSITFTPTITDLKFTSNDYNVLINNATELRKSTSRYITPTSGTILVTLSELQDSLYFDTGWSNARYVGSRTGDIEVSYDVDGTGSVVRTDYGTVPATLAGRTFQAEYFPTGSTTGSIFDITNRTATLTELIHDGNTILPTSGSGNITVYKIIEGNRLRKLEESFLYLNETQTILETNNIGLIINYITSGSI